MRQKNTENNFDEGCAAENEGSTIVAAVIIVAAVAFAVGYLIAVALGVGG